MVGTEMEIILENVAILSDPAFYDKMKNSANPYGDGRAGEKIVDILVEKHEKDELVVEASDTRGMQFHRKIIPVDNDLAGVTVQKSGLEIIRVIKDNIAQYPLPSLVLGLGMQIEIRVKN